MSNVIQLNNVVTGNIKIDPNKVLDCAKDQLTEVLVIGEDTDGILYVSSSTAKKKELLWLIERVKFKLMNGDFDE